MGDFNVFVGGVSGVFKGLKVSHNKGVHNVKNLQKLKEITQRNEVTVLNWADKLENEILIGYNNQLVKIFDLSSNTFTFNEPRKVGEGPIRGISRINSALVTAVESGVVKVWGEKETLLETGGPISRMRHSPNEENIIGTGGKENDLKLWDIETGKATFTAKNVRHDWLELRVPVWVMDLAFIPDSRQVGIATRYGHVRLYDPSTPTRRPVCQVEEKDVSFTCIAPAPRSNHVIVGCAAGNMYLVDLRGKGLLLNKFRGFMGGVRAVMCPPTEPYVLSVSLDRHFRVHHLDTKKLLFKEYLQSRLSALLIKSSFTMEDIKEETPDIKEEDKEEMEADEEYEQMFNEMEVITDKLLAHDKKIKSRKGKAIKEQEISEEIIEDEIVRKLNTIHNEEKVVEQENALKTKKSKSKRLKQAEDDIIISEEEVTEQESVAKTTKSKSKRLKQAEDEDIISEEVTEQENVAKTKKSKAKRLKQAEDEDIISEEEVTEQEHEPETKTSKSKQLNQAEDEDIISNEKVTKQENLSNKRLKTKKSIKSKRLKQAEDEDVIVLD